MAAELKLYDTLTREKRVFQPLDPRNVRMYVCGPTVYDFAHIGNARPVIVFDVLFRLLRHIYGDSHVTYVRNITDVDDKINARAAERGISIQDLTKTTYENFKADVAALGCLPPTVEPRATEHIAEMKTLIERLIASGHAYVAEGNVLFDVPSMPDYGRLSKRPMDEMIAGARVEVAPYKKDAQDFVLWKPSKPGEPSWASPAGIATPGRPGWHIECSAMAWKHLGQTFDIHGGGIDLVFPHHENEIAQSRCAFHTDVMANYWMHNGFLQVEGEKMSKSLGNFVTIRELLRTKKFGGQKWKGYVLKFAMLQTHYSQPIDWTVRLLEQSEARLNRWREFAAERTVRRRDKGFFNDFVNALADDLNTPAAFAIVDKRISGEFPTEEERYTVYKILRLLGVRGRQTRVARVAAGFGALFDSVQSIPSEAWSEIDLKIEQANFITLIETKSYPEFEIVASLEAIGEYWRAFRFRTFNFDVAQILLSEDGPRYRGKRDLRALADSFRRRMQDLGCFSKNDWQNFLATVAERPRFKSGNLKPEAELISYLQALSNVDQSHRSNWALHSKELLELKETLLKSAEPPESEFEKQVRRLIADREIARRERRYADADRIRNELAAMRVVLKDAKDPKSGEIKTTWEIAR